MSSGECRQGFPSVCCQVVAVVVLQCFDYVCWGMGTCYLQPSSSPTANREASSGMSELRGLKLYTQSPKLWTVW